MKAKPAILASSCAALLAFFPAPAAAQSVFIWDGDNAPLTGWSIGSNWAGDAAPDGDDVLRFAGLNGLSTTNDFAAYSGHRIVFDASAGAFTLAGNALTLAAFGAAAPRIENNALNLQTIILPLTLTGAGSGNSAEIAATSGAVLFGITGTVALAGDTNLQLLGNAGQTITFDGAISGGGVGNKVTLRENSVAVFNAANTFAGNLEIDAGEAQLGALGSLAASSTVVLGNAATPTVAAAFTLGDVDGGQALANNFVVNAGDPATRTLRTLNFAGTNTLSGNVTLNAPLVVETAGAALSLTGSVSGGGQSVRKTGFGTLVLGGANTFSGGLVIEGGTVSVATDAALGAPGNVVTLNNGAVLQASASFATDAARVLTLGPLGGQIEVLAGAALISAGAITDGGLAQPLSKTGPGILQLDGPAAHTGGTTIIAGTLALGAAERLADAAPLTMNGGVFDLAAFNETLGLFTLGAGTVNGTGTLTPATNDLQAGTINAVLGGLTGVNKNFGGTVTLNAANTFIGAVTINGGILSVNGDAALGNVNNGIVLNGGALSALTSFTLAAPRGVVANPTPGNGLSAAAGVTLTVDLGITGAGGIAKGGTGTVEFVGATPHTFGGPVDVNLGVLALNKTGGNAIPAVPLNITSNTPGSAIVRLLASEQIDNTAPITFSAAGVQSPTLDLNGFTETISGFTASTVTAGLAAGVNGVRTGAGGALILAGPLTFNHNRNATGNTGRELLITATGTFATTVTGGGTLDLGGVARTITVNTSHTQANPIATIETLIVNGGIVKEGSGFLSITANNTFAGGIVINGGRVRLGGTPQSFSGNIVANPGGTLWLFAIGTDNAAFNASLGVAGNTITLDGGTLLAQYSGQGDRTMTDRPLLIGAGGATINVFATSYTNFAENTQHQLRLTSTLGTVFTGTSGLTKEGAGRLTLNSTSPAFSGPWTLNNGTFESAPANLGDGSATNTLTVNGGNFAINGAGTIPLVTLNGGALSANNGNRTFAAPINVTAPSFLFPNDFYSDTNAARTLALSGLINAGANGLTVAVNRAALDTNSGAVVLTNAGNVIDGTITIGDNLRLESNSATGVGRTIGAASIVLAGGRLVLRDNGAGSNGVLTYENSVAVIAPTGLLANGDLTGTAILDVGRSSGTNTGNVFQLGGLDLSAGLPLDLVAANGYGVEFLGATLGGGALTFNVPTGELRLSGGISGGTDLTKNGAGTLAIGAPSGPTYSGTTAINAGVVRFASLAAVGGTGASVTAASGGAGAAGYAIDQAFVARFNAASAGVIAAGADSANPLDFTGVPVARFGASGTAVFTGTFTQPGSNYRLGGGGGTLVLPGINALTGARGLDLGTNGTPAGVVALPGTNDFTGTITFTGGQLVRPQTNASLGNPANVLVGDGGGVQFAAGAPFDLFTARTITFAAGGFILDTNGSDYTPTVAIGSGGAGGFTKAGAGALTLTLPTTYAGPTSVTGGALVFDDPAKFASSSGVALGAGTLRFTGATARNLGKTLTLAASGGGTVQVTAPTGTLALDQVVSGGPAAGNVALIVSGAGTTVLGVVNTFTGDVVIDGGTLSVAGQGSVDATRLGVGTKTVTIQNGGTLRITGTSAANFDPNSNKSFVIGPGGGNLEVFNDATNTVVGVFDNAATQLSGSGPLRKTGTGRFVFGAATIGHPNYTGTLTIGAGQVDLRNSQGAGISPILLEGGTLRLQQETAITFATTVTVTGNSTLSVDRITTPTGLTLTLGTLNIGGQTLALTNANTFKLTASTVNLTGNPVFNVGGTTNLFTAGLVAGPGFGFTKTGAQPMTLGLGVADAVANTYTGATSVTGGTLTLDKQPNLPGGGGAIVGNVSVGGTGTLLLNGDEQILDTSTLTLDPGGVFNLNGRTETLLNVVFNGGSLVKGGGTINITNLGTDLLIFDNENLAAQNLTTTVRYVGATQASTIASATLASATNVNEINVANSTDASGNDLVITGTVDGASQTLLKTGPGTLLLSVANPFTGTLNVGGGAVAYTDETALGNAANALIVSTGGLLQPRGIAPTRLPQIGTGGGGFEAATGQTITISAVLANVAGQSGGFVKGGAGTVALSGANIFDGGVLSQAGNLQILGGAGLNPIGNGPIALAGGSVELRNDVSNVLGNAVQTVGAGGVLNFQRATGTTPAVTLGLGNVTVPAGSTLTLVGTQSNVLNVGNVTVLGSLLYGNAAGLYVNTGTSSVVVAPGANVMLGSGAASTIRLGLKQAVNTTGTIIATFDASAAASFTGNAGNFDVGVETASGVNTVTGTLRLPENASITAATRVAIAETPNQGGTGTLQPGAGLTTITTPLFTVGGLKGSGNLNFPAPGANTTLTINNGLARTMLNIGTNLGNTATAPTTNFNATGATLIADLGAVQVGLKTGNGSTGNNGGSTATWNLGASAVTDVDILVNTGTALHAGRYEVNNMPAIGTRAITGTVTIGGGNVVVQTLDAVAPAIALGSFTNAATAGSDTGNTNISANGNLNLTGGTLNVLTGGGPALALTPTNANITLAPYRLNATVTLTGGTLSLGNDFVVGTATGLSVFTSTLNLSGGTLDLNGNDIGALTNFAFTGGTLREAASLARALTQTGAASQLVVSGNNMTIAGAYTLADGGAVVDAGRTLTPSGGTTMTSGDLLVNGALAGTLLASGGTVRGDGALGVANLVGGTLAPGASAGQLDTGDLTIGAGATLSLEIGGTVAGTQHDQLGITGTLGLGGTLALTTINGFSPGLNDRFWVALNDGGDAISGTFANVPITDVPTNSGVFTAGGQPLFVYYSADFATNALTGGNDLLIFVPEPGAAVLLLAGLGALGMRRGRRHPASRK